MSILRASRLILYTFLILLGRLILTSCSFMLSFAECETNDECSQRRGEGWTCSLDSICVSGPTTEPEDEFTCTEDSVCIDQHSEGWTCSTLGECQAPSSLLG